MYNTYTFAYELLKRSKNIFLNKFKSYKLKKFKSYLNTKSLGNSLMI